MTIKDIQELVKLLDASDISEFNMKNGEFELSIRTKHYIDPEHISAIAAAPVQQVVPVQPTYTPPPAPIVEAPAQPAANTPSPAQPAASDDSGYLEVKSPIVGTFYRSASPEKPPYAKVGDTIEVGSVVCIVEAMKLFNEIESEIAGKIVKVLVEDAQPVEYDQVLFLVDPKG
ncbi:MAG: acetyl-CoA carboxylase biotin carboxyl carrier protein [Bacteroidota bacterium]